MEFGRNSQNGFAIFSYTPENEEAFDFNREMQLINERYQAENALLEAIVRGDEDGAIRSFLAYAELMSNPSQKPHPTSNDPLRDFKNSVLTMNTLFRKAIEGNYVHPIYIHETSSHLGNAIEQAHTEKELSLLIQEMVESYCHLVREYSLAAYSPPIRKAILYIDLNLCAPLSTKDIAQDQFISPNYLSSRFRQEMGVNISDYIQERRIKMAAHLLTATHQSVQEVAASVGIGDASYFSKQFKKVTGFSPLAYRKKLHSS